MEHPLSELLEKWQVYKIEGLNEWLLPYKLTSDEVELVGRYSAYGFLTKESEQGWHLKFDPKELDVINNEDNARYSE